MGTKGTGQWAGPGAVEGDRRARGARHLPAPLGDLGAARMDAPQVDPGHPILIQTPALSGEPLVLAGCAWILGSRSRSA